MLYAVPTVYMDVLRLPINVASARHAGHIESALKSLEHYDHPAATLAEASPPRHLLESNLDPCLRPKKLIGRCFLLGNLQAFVGTCWSTLSTRRRRHKSRLEG
jgi:hypothetical protein